MLWDDRTGRAYGAGTQSLEENIERARTLLAGAERVLIGAGAGLSTAAGLSYSGERFQRYFAPFIRRYGMTDMYSAGFYPFRTPEDKWAYWSQHIWVNRFQPGATQLYRDLFTWACERDYFVITTNVDAQFELAGFDRDRIFATQGDYGFIQCARGCHERIYPDRELVEAMRKDTGAEDAFLYEGAVHEANPACLDESTCGPCDEASAPRAVTMRTRLTDASLVPKCPVCGGPMEVHLRCDGTFVEDAYWRAAQERYFDFVEGARSERTVLLELGVGWNTPVWIRYPFEQLAQMAGSPLIRMNYDDAFIGAHIPHGVSLQGDIAQIWPLICE